MLMIQEFVNDEESLIEVMHEVIYWPFTYRYNHFQITKVFFKEKILLESD